MNQHISLTTQAHSIIQQHLTPDDIAVDATVGNGYDTVFLARQVGDNGKVFGFDIQQQAIDSTRSKLEKENLWNCIQLFHCSHHKMQQTIPSYFHGKIKAIMFNLGYLPGSDKSIITQAETTINALEQAVKLLATQGVVTIAAYPGHSGGETETLAIKHWQQKLAVERYNVEIIYSSDKITAPRLYVIKKLKKN